MRNAHAIVDCGGYRSFIIPDLNIADAKRVHGDFVN